MSDTNQAHAATSGDKPKLPAPRAEYDYDDLSPCLAFQWLDASGRKFKSVGWITKNRPYARGTLEPENFQKLLALLADPWTPACVPRRLECPFCPIVNPDHGKKKQPWWAVQRGTVDGLELILLRTPETMAHVEAHRLTKSRVSLGSETTSLFVPACGRIYVAHPLTAHFIDAHGYAPPAEFWYAVRNCPPMSSLAYLEALVSHGPRDKTWAAAVWAASVLKSPDPLVDLK